MLTSETNGHFRMILVNMSVQPLSIDAELDGVEQVHHCKLIEQNGNS